MLHCTFHQNSLYNSQHRHTLRTLHKLHCMFHQNILCIYYPSLCYIACSIKTSSATPHPVSAVPDRNVTSHIRLKSYIACSIKTASATLYLKTRIKRKAMSQNATLTISVFLSLKYVLPFVIAHSARRKGTPASPVLPLVFLLHASYVIQ